MEGDALSLSPNCGGLAQLVERLHGMQEVNGSIPLSSTEDKPNSRKVLRGF